MDWQRYRRANLARVAVLLAVVFGAAFFLAWQLHGPSREARSEPIRQGTIIESVYGIGTVLANRSYQLKPGVVSTIETFYVKEGDTVKKGAPLAKLDRVIYRAPFSGTVTYLPFKEGENVFAQVPVLTLVDLMDRYLVVSLEQQGALRIHPGQKAIMSFDTIRQQSYTGTVESIYSSGGNFLARIDVSSLPQVVLPGMSADVAIQIRKRDHALIAPVAALKNGDTLSVKRGIGGPKNVEVKVGIVDKSQAEIVSGDVHAGDRVLIPSREPSGFVPGFQDNKTQHRLTHRAQIRIQARYDHLSEHQLDRDFYGLEPIHVFWDAPPAGIKGHFEIQNPQSWYERLRSDPRVEAFAPLLTAPALFHSGKISVSSSLNGCVPDQQKQVTDIAKDLTEGRLESISVGGNRIILGDELAKRLGAAVNQTIWVTVSTNAPQPFKVVGSFATGDPSLDLQAFAALSDVQRMSGAPNRINEIAVRLKNPREATGLATDWSKLAPEKIESWDQLS